MYSVRDVQKRYGVTTKTVLGWIHSGELKAFNVGRRIDSKKPRWRITAEALADFERLRTPSPPPQKVRSRKWPDEGVIQFYAER